MALIVFGLDGMNEDLLDLCKEDMPFLYSLRNKAFHSTLKGVNPYLSGSSWTSIYTGKSIGEHGFVANCYYDQQGTLKLIKEQDVKEEFFYEAIEKAGYKVFLLDMPFSRSTKIKGDIVKNIFDSTTNQSVCKPLSLKQKFPSIYNYINTKWKAKSILGALEHMDQTVIYNQEIIKEVLNHQQKTNEYDLLCFQFAVIDWIQHKILLDLLAKRNSAETRMAKKTLNRIDKCLKWVIDNLNEEDDFMLFSDHGSSIFRGVLHINCFLKQKGFLKEKSANPNFKEKKSELFLDYLVKKVKEYGPLHNISKKWYRLIRTYLPYDPVNKKGVKVDRELSKAVNELKHVPIIKLLEQNHQERIQTREKIKRLIKSELGLESFNIEEYYNVSDPKKIQILHQRFGHIFIEIADLYDSDTIVTNKSIIHKKAQFHDSKAIFLAYSKTKDASLQNTKLATRINGSLFDITPTILDYYSIPHKLNGKNLNVYTRTYQQHKVKKNPTESLFHKLKY
jgi:predicted AlkP superfamily phosphohydrolase/phosphomutase